MSSPAQSPRSVSHWSNVKDHIVKEGLMIARKNDALVLSKLSMLNMGWLEMIPAEWQEIYGALYDEATDTTGCPLDHRENEEYAEDHTTINEEQADHQTTREPSTLYQKLHASEEKKKIAKDIHRTFSVFGKYSCSKDTLGRVYSAHEESFRKSLMDVLLAASYERGYCQGLNFIAGNFLLNLSTVDCVCEETGEVLDASIPEFWRQLSRRSFICLCFLLRHTWMFTLFDPQCSSLLEYMKIFEKKLRRHNPGVYKHWKTIGFDPQCVTVEWFTTSFITVGPGALANSVLDLLLAGCEDALLKVALALVDEVQDSALGMDLEAMQVSFKTMAREANVVRVVARALTMPSLLFFPDTNMLLTMVRNIEVMQPSGTRGEYVYTTRPVDAADLGELATGQLESKRAGKAAYRGERRERVEVGEEEGVGEEEEEEEEEQGEEGEEGEESDNEGPASASLAEESSPPPNSEVPSLYHRGLGAAATMARQAALISEGHVTLYMLDSFYSSVMGDHYRYTGPTNADIGLGRVVGGRGRAINSRAHMARAQRVERKGLRKHYRQLLRKLMAAEEEPSPSLVAAARAALLRATRSNGALVLAKDDANQGIPALTLPRARSRVLETTGIFRFLDKTEYWKDGPRKRSWAHRLVTTSTSGGQRNSSRGLRGKGKDRGGVTAIARVAEESECLTRGDDIAMQALLELERKSKAKDDTYLPRGWRDIRLEANRKGQHTYHSLNSAASTPTDRVTGEKNSGATGVIFDSVGGILDVLPSFGGKAGDGTVGGGTDEAEKAAMSHPHRVKTRGEASAEATEGSGATPRRRRSDEASWVRYLAASEGKRGFSVPDSTSGETFRRRRRSRAVTWSIPPITSKRSAPDVDPIKEVRWEPTSEDHHDQGGSNKQLRMEVAERREFRRENAAAVQKYHRREMEEEYLRASTRAGRVSEHFRGSAIGDMLSLASRKHPERASDVLLNEEIEGGEDEHRATTDGPSSSNNTTVQAQPGAEQAWDLLSVLTLGLVDSSSGATDTSSSTAPPVVVQAEEIVLDVYYDGGESNSDFSEEGCVC